MDESTLGQGPEFAATELVLTELVETIATPNLEDALALPAPPAQTETLYYPWQWQNQTYQIAYEVTGQGEPILLLPAFSTVSSRSEMRGLARELEGRYQVWSLDWLGFGQSDRPAFTYEPKFYRAFLRSFVQEMFPTPVVVVAAGHAAGYVMQLAQEQPLIWKWVVLVAPTWRGPLPTMMGENNRSKFQLIQKLVALPVLGSFLYWLNTTKKFLQFMYRRHVFANGENLGDRLLSHKQRLARQKNARFAASAFVTGELDPLRRREDWMNLFQPLPLPTLMVIGNHMPKKSRQEAEIIAHFSAVQSVRIAGSLGLHEEYPETLAQTIVPFLEKYLSRAA